LLLDSFGQFAEPIDVAGHKVAPEPVGEAEGAFQVDGIPDAPTSQCCAVECFRAELKLKPWPIDAYH
jgi:hypothetical protein